MREQIQRDYFKNTAAIERDPQSHRGKCYFKGEHLHVYQIYCFLDKSIQYSLVAYKISVKPF